MKLPEVKIVIGDVKYEHTFNEDVLIDRTNLDEEFATQAEKFAFYAFLAAKAKHAYEQEKFLLEQIYAVLDHEKRANAELTKARDKSFKYTEKMCEAEIITDKRYKDQKRKTLDVKLLSEQLEKASMAIAQRKDMLVQLGLGSRIGNAPVRAMDPQVQHAHDIIAQNKRSQEEAAAEAANSTESAKRRRRPKSAE